MIAVPVVMIAGQPDLGTALIIGASGLLVLLLAGIPWRYIFGALGLGLVSAPALWILLRDYQRQRILTLFDPERDPLGAGWNIIQSQTAIGSGGLFGKGLGFVIGNPVSRALLKPLEMADYGRRGMAMAHEQAALAAPEWLEWLDPFTKIVDEEKVRARN